MTMAHSNDGVTDESLRSIYQDLSTVEEGLNDPRATSVSRGRAMFSSISSMLSSISSRIDQHYVGSSNSNDDNEQQSADLLERVQTAHRAHSNRIPLALLRDSQRLERETSTGSLVGGGRPSLLVGPKEQEEEHQSNTRRTSLVASRRMLSGVETINMDLHASAAALLSPVAEEQKHESGATVSTQREKIPDIVRISQAKPEPVIDPSAPRLGEYAVYSWGKVTLHDDGARDAPAKVSKDDRIGRLEYLQYVDCGPNHVACVTKQGEVYAAGDNRNGQVLPFERNAEFLARPRLVEALGDQTIVRQISCGLDHTAVLTSLGAALTWGNNAQGQLGHFGNTEKTTFCTPKAMSLGPGVKAKAVACGGQFTIVLTTRLSLLVCGALAPVSDCDKPRELPAMAGLPLDSIAAGRSHAVAITVWGTCYAWGSNVDACCGRPYPDWMPNPVPMATPEAKDIDTLLGPVHQAPPLERRASGSVVLANDISVAHASCSSNHTALVTRSGHVLVCGSNSHGQMGLSSKDQASSSRLKTISHPDAAVKFISAKACQEMTVLLDENGDVWVTSEEGSLTRTLDGTKIHAIAAGGRQVIAISSPSDILCLKHLGETRTIAEDVQELVQKVSEKSYKADEANDELGEELIDKLSEMLKHPSLLNSLFAVVSDLDKLYRDLTSVGNVQLQQALANATETSILTALKSLQNSNAQLKYGGTVRFLLHYIRFFQRDERTHAITFDANGSCIAAICETLLSLPFEGFKNVLGWIGGFYSPDMFVAMLIKPLLSQLEKSLQVDIDDDGVEHYNIARRAAPQIGALLRWLHVAGERDGLSSTEDFYCQSVANMPLETLYYDLMHKKGLVEAHESHGFLLSENPFLIPPSTKRDLLQIESQVNMMKTASLNPSVNEEEGTMSIDPFFVLEVRRDYLLEDTLKAIKGTKSSDLRKKIRVKFTGEEGIDAGGVAKEFFQLLCEELFDINSPLWTRRYGDEITWFNSDCTWDVDSFEQAGVLFALALYNNVLLDVHFPQAVYRKLLDRPLGMEDVIDLQLRKGLQQLLDYDGGDEELVFCLTFEVTWTFLGQDQKLELKPGGGNVEVTRENKEEYVLLYVKWILVDSIKPQWDAFQRGINLILDGSSLTDLFAPTELELLVVGSPELDFAALQSNTEYEGGYTSDSPVVQNLWQFVKSADNQTQTKFLKFTCGSTKAPIGGLGAMPFKVQRAGPDSPQLPTSHTCFNTILLPDYGDAYDKLSERLGRAVLECEGFGLE